MEIRLDLLKTLLKRFWVPFCLILIFLTAFFIRVFFSWDSVFSDPIKYSADDGIYHMRLVENMLLGGHFPFRIYFDPFTNFPYGTYIHFTPLYDWLLALIIWIISFGKPTLEIINKIAPFYPAVMGALLIFVIYFITKILFKNRGIAILASFLSGISPSFLYRSTLGNTDHHVAEVLFSTLFIMFFMMVLQNSRNSFSSLKFWIFAVLSGFSLGLYFLAWTGAIMFLFLIFCFIVLYYLIEYFLGNRKNWILYAGIIIFLTSFLMILPFFGHPDLFNTYMYNILHLESFLLGILVFIILLLSDRLFLKKNINPKLMPIFLACAIFLVLSLFKIFLPDLFFYLISGVKEVNTGMVEYPLARELVGEMAPVSFNGLVGNFYAVFIVSLISLGIIFYKFLKNRKPEYLLIILWAVFMMLMSGIIPYFGQVRFSYYLSPIFSILFSFTVVSAIIFGWQGLQKSKELEEPNIFKKYILIGSVVMIFNGIYFLFYPFPFNAGADFPKSLPYIIGDIFYNAKMSPAEEDRYEVVEWLKNNTPDTGIDYYELYKEPGINNDTGKVNAYTYPESAYGVLAVWDFGHMITYYGHRIPVSNPFQQGIGRKNKDGSIRPGYATFFLERDENAATGYLDQLKTRYVISDSASVNSDGVFQQMIKWAQDDYDGYLEENSENLDLNKYYDSMIARLHLFDGRQTEFTAKISEEDRDFEIKPLSRFRLLYESDTTGFTLKIDAKNDVKNFKVFQYVKGAVIKGFAPLGAEVEVSVKITTNQDREFTYKNTAESKNGSFKITVPYSTGFQKNSETKAEKYMIKIGNYTKEVEVSEQDILNGKIINI